MMGQTVTDAPNHEQNIYKDTKPEMSAFLKNWPVKYLAAGVYLSEAPSPPRFLLGWWTGEKVEGR